MKNHLSKWLLYSALIVLYVLHNDLWFWNDGRLVWGIPIGLMYHVVYCLAAAGLMYLLVTYAWPVDLEVEGEQEPKA